MALALKVDKLDAVADEHKGLYKQVEGGYELDITGLPAPDDTTGLKTALTKERNTVTTLQQQLATLQKQVADGETAALEKNQEYQKLYGQEKEVNKTLAKKLHEQSKEHYVEILSTGLTGDKNQRKMLKSVMLESVQVDENGNRSIVGFDTEDSFLAHIKKDYPFLVAGSQASGGGAAGGAGGGATRTAVLKYTDYLKLPPVEQSKFLAGGGTLEE